MQRSSQVWVRRQAAALGVQVARGELVGLLPARVVQRAAGRPVDELPDDDALAAAAHALALDELLHAGGDRGDKMTLGDTLEDPKAPDPINLFEGEETKYILAKAINTLPEREKIVVTLYYYEGLTLAEIGQVLGVTESRICQMHTKAVLQLRSKISESHEDDLE